MGSMCQKPIWNRLLCFGISWVTPSASTVMEASTAEKTPSKTMETEPESRPKITPVTPTTTVAAIDCLRTVCSLGAVMMLFLLLFRRGAYGLAMSKWWRRLQT
ncbi:hypothetical protein D9M72_541110 [compost metagenome]